MVSFFEIQKKFWGDIMENRSIHVCVDRVIPLQNKTIAAELAINENPDNKPILQLRPGVSMNPAKLALLVGKTWQNGRKLGVTFLDGSSTQKKDVKKHAKTWSKYANIKFDFNAGSKAEIRISFKADTGSWSYVGTDCLLQDIPKKEPTMNFGWLKDDTDDMEYRRVVCHEFGHALGAIHEHQNPKGGIKWNLDAVYKYFMGAPNYWTKEEVDHNVIKKYSVDQLNGTEFDMKSIMLYHFPKEFIIGGMETPENSDLSSGDKAFINKIYPK